MEVAQLLHLCRAIKPVPLIGARFAPAAHPLLPCKAGFMGADASGSPVNSGLITFTECSFKLITFLAFHAVQYLFGCPMSAPFEQR